MVNKKTKLIKQYENAITASIKLMTQLDILGSLASEIYGEELSADICNGDEIEFRTLDNLDGLSHVSLHLEDILNKIA